MTHVVSHKFIIIGSSGVGKTCLLKRLIDGTFTDDSASTIGVVFDSLILNIDNRKVKLQIWEMADQERFRSIAKTDDRNAVGVIRVFDLTDRKSFDSLTSWLNDIHALCDSNAVTQLIGKKSDLSARRAVTIVEAEAFAKQHQMGYLEAPAKIGESVRDIRQGRSNNYDKGIEERTPAGKSAPADTARAAREDGGTCCSSFILSHHCVVLTYR
jgi:small GTP-binding protein